MWDPGRFLVLEPVLVPVLLRFDRQTSPGRSAWCLGRTGTRSHMKSFLPATNPMNQSRLRITELNDGNSMDVQYSVV